MNRPAWACGLLEIVKQTAQWSLVMYAIKFELTNWQSARVSQIWLFNAFFLCHPSLIVNENQDKQDKQDVLFLQVKCLVQEREEPRDTGRCSGTTSKESPSLQLGGWLAVEVSSVFLAWSMRRPEASSRCSWRMWSGMQSPTLSMLVVRQWQHLMLSMPSRGRAGLYTDLEDNSFIPHTQHLVILITTILNPIIQHKTFKLCLSYGLVMSSNEIVAIENCWHFGKTWSHMISALTTPSLAKLQLSRCYALSCLWRMLFALSSFIEFTPPALGFSTDYVPALSHVHASVLLESRKLLQEGAILGNSIKIEVYS